MTAQCKCYYGKKYCAGPGRIEWGRSWVRAIIFSGPVRVGVKGSRALRDWGAKNLALQVFCSTSLMYILICLFGFFSPVLLLIQHHRKLPGTVIFSPKWKIYHKSFTERVLILNWICILSKYVTQHQLMRLFAVKSIVSYEQKCKVRSKFLKN